VVKPFLSVFTNKYDYFLSKKEPLGYYSKGLSYHNALQKGDKRRYKDRDEIWLHAISNVVAHCTKGESGHTLIGFLGFLLSFDLIRSSNRMGLHT